GITLTGCGRYDRIVSAQEVTGGDAPRGRQLVYAYNCGSCHVIPGISEAKGTVGPPLGGFGNRNYIAGSLANTPEQLSRWIREPQQAEPGTAMPNLGVTEKE